MRIFYSFIFTCFLFAAVSFAQTAAPTPPIPSAAKPLSQAEYVQLLYTLERNPSKHDEIVETIRKRGIGFTLTDGLKSLTASKSKNDVTLRRTLEEAARRKDNPEAYQLPAEKESADVLAKARELVLKTASEMPDFLVKQVVLRSEAYAGTNKFLPLDRLLIAVGYRTTGWEEYRLLSINGISVPNDSKNNPGYSEAGGSTSTGEFVNALKTLFEAETQTEFEAVDTDVVRGRRSIVFGFEATRSNYTGVLRYLGVVERAIRIGVKGKIWIDRDNFRILRYESQGTEIPSGFPITGLTRNIDYDWVTINNQKYLLPWNSEVKMVIRDGRESIERRNEIRFREYRKFDVDIKILDAEEPAADEPAKEETPAVKKP